MRTPDDPRRIERANHQETPLKRLSSAVPTPDFRVLFESAPGLYLHLVRSHIGILCCVPGPIDCCGVDRGPVVRPVVDQPRWAVVDLDPNAVITVGRKGPVIDPSYTLAVVETGLTECSTARFLFEAETVL